MAAIPISEDQQRVLWYIRMRWGAVLLVSVLVLYLKYLAQFDLPILPNLIIIGLIILYNSSYPFLVRKFKVFSENVFFTDIRSMLDLIVITLLVHFSGGIKSPFILLYMVELMAISIFRFTRTAYYLAAVASIFYMSNCLLEAYFIIPHYHLTGVAGSSYVNVNFIIAISAALFFSLTLLIYMSSYFANRLYSKQLEIEQLSHSKIDFLNNVMHEIKSPLTSVIGYSDLNLKGRFGQLSGQQRNSLDIISRQASRILGMINNLLDIARLESGRVTIAKRPGSLSGIIGRVAEELKPQLDGAGLELIKELDHNLPEVPMDEDKINEVVTNLLSNAIKFSKPGRNIYISTQRSGLEAQISVRDEGLGIASEDLPYIFDKFHRAGTEAAEVKGTGLGLALSKTIVKAHGGRMWAASGGRDKGAVFHFTLPL